MHLTKKKILSAVKIAAGDVREARELVRLIEERAVYIEPKPGHPVLDELETPAGRRFKTAFLRSMLTKAPAPAWFEGVPLLREYWYLNLKNTQSGEPNIKSLFSLFTLLLDPEEGLSGSTRPMYFPRPAILAPEQFLLLPYPTHRHFIASDPDCPFVSAFGSRQMWDDRGSSECDAISVSPVASTKAWLGLSVLYSVACQQKSREMIRRIGEFSSDLPSEAIPAVEEVCMAEACEELNGTAKLLERIVSRSMKTFVGRQLPTSPEGGLFNKMAWRKVFASPQVRRRRDLNSIRDEDLIAQVIHTLIDQELPSRSKAEKKSRLSLLVTMVDGYSADLIPPVPTVSA